MYLFIENLFIIESLFCARKQFVLNKNFISGTFSSRLDKFNLSLDRSPMTDSSRMISGIGALNMTTDTESSNIIVGRIDCAPPAAPILGRRKRFPPLNSNITGNASFLNLTGKPIVPPVLNLNRFLSLETSGNAQRHNRDNSFGVLPHGTLSWSNKGVSINQEPSAAAVRLDFSSLAILSPFSGATTPAQVCNKKNFIRYLQKCFCRTNC